MIPAYAVIPSAGRGCLPRCVAAVREQAEVIVVSNGPRFRMPAGVALEVDDPERAAPANIGRWWNAGIEMAETLAMCRDWPAWDVLVLNDDAVIGPGTVAALSEAMRAADAEMAYGDQRDGSVTGWCFLLRGEAGLRADEQFPWWYSDDDLEAQARHRLGVVVVPGVRVAHLHPNESTASSEHLRAVSREGGQRFAAKWATMAGTMEARNA